MQNGLPCWHFDRIDSPCAGRTLKTLDPQGRLARVFACETIVGGVVFGPADLESPGVIRMSDTPNDRMVIGEVDNSRSARLERIAAVVGPAGWRTEISGDTRSAKWSKLVGNAVWNPLCALTQAAANQIASYPPTRALALAVMKAAIAVARAVGARLDADAEQAVADTARRPPSLSSTLADVRAGRQLEFDALSHAIIETGEMTGVPTPRLRNVVARAGMLDRRIVEDRVAIRPLALP